MKNVLSAARLVVAVYCLTSLTGCSKTLTSGTALSGATTSVVAFTPDSASRAAALSDYQINYLGSNIDSIGWVGNATTCSAGSTPDALKQKELQRLNYYRRLCGLPVVALDAAYSAQAQQAALIMRSNNAIDHYPPANWSCLTEDGELGAAYSNLCIGTAGPGAIDLYINDLGVTDLGHRRWALFPSLTKVGSGDTDFTNALYVIGGFGTRPDLPFSAYPGSGYIPIPLVYDVWSFSVSAADFSSATVTVSDTYGLSYPVNLTPTATGYGDNTLSWTFENNFSQTQTSDLQLNVTVSGVKVGGKEMTYKYSVYMMTTGT
jgi:uncharacterized protein YkwD